VEPVRHWPIPNTVRSADKLYPLSSRVEWWSHRSEHGSATATNLQTCHRACPYLP